MTVTTMRIDDGVEMNISPHIRAAILSGSTRIENEDYEPEEVTAWACAKCGDVYEYPNDARECCKPIAPKQAEPTMKSCPVCGASKDE